MKSDNDEDEGHSVTLYLARLGQQDGEAVQQIWLRYFQSLLQVARAKLSGIRDPAVDGEDILVSVFDRFFRAAGEGRFPRLDDRDDLWQILLMLTERKVRDQFRRSAAAKRGHRTRLSSGALGEIDLAQLREAVDRGPSPEFAAQLNDQLSHCLCGVADKTLKEIAVSKLEGYTNPEIAKRLGISLSGVERKLRLIRQHWQNSE